MWSEESNKVSLFLAMMTYIYLLVICKDKFNRAYDVCIKHKDGIDISAMAINSTL